MKYDKILTKRYLIQEYSIKETSPPTIANKVRCSEGTVRKYLKKHNIKKRTQKEAFKLLNRKGKNNSNYIDGRKSKNYYCKEPNCTTEISYQTWRIGNGRCVPCARKIQWKDKTFRDKTIKASMKAQNLSPNKPEKKLIKLLKKILPNQYKFVGDGKLIVGGFCPDFINTNGQKKIIEHYGTYWHNTETWKKRDKRRLIAYKRYRYKTLIIWEHELKNLNKVENKIINFNIK